MSITSAKSESLPRLPLLCNVNVTEAISVGMSLIQKSCFVFELNFKKFLLFVIFKMIRQILQDLLKNEFFVPIGFASRMYFSFRNSQLIVKFDRAVRVWH